MMTLLYIAIGIGSVIFFCADPKVFFWFMLCLWTDVAVAKGITSLNPESFNPWVIGILLPVAMVLLITNPKLFWGLLIGGIFVIGYGFIFLVLVLMFLGRNANKKS